MKQAQKRSKGSLLRRAALAASLAVGATGALAAPAQATTHFIGVNGDEARCVNSPSYWGICLYYNGLSSAYWGTFYPATSLSGKTFVSGTGSGYGHSVPNNANAVDCTRWVGSYCGIFKGTNYTGYEDYLGWGQHGNLYLTWNAENSVAIFD